jgi:hypothetical protein
MAEENYDRPDGLEQKLDDVTAEGRPPDPRPSQTKGPYHNQQLGGIEKTGEGDDLQEPSSAQGGG